MKIYLSPSKQTANLYVAGNTYAPDVYGWEATE